VSDSSLQGPSVTDINDYRLVRPAYIPAIGTFQDGGLKHNNPVNLALWESRQIWPSVTRPDLVVSLGTGTGRAVKSPSAPNFRHVFKDGFVPRLYRSFMSSLDGQSVWRDFINGLDERSREDYFRFNICFPDEEPALDNTDSMDALRESVHLQTKSIQDCADTASALLISSFFFELAVLPQFDSGLYRCRGTIRCRLRGAVMIRSLIKLHPSHLEFVTDTETLAPFSGDSDVCGLCHRYCKQVEFYVRHPNDIMTISLQIGLGKRRKIGGFPQSMSWFVRQQNLDALFGTSDHGNLGGLSCQRCISGQSVAANKTAKRRVGQRESLSSNKLKRRRLVLEYDA